MKTISTTHTLSAAALRELADMIEREGQSDTKYVPVKIGLVRDGDDWVALAELAPVHDPRIGKMPPALRVL